MKINKVAIGKRFEIRALKYLKKKFDSVEWLSENKKSVCDFKCTRDNKTYFVEAKFSNGGSCYTLRKDQNIADYLITTKHNKIILIPKIAFKDKITFIKNPNFIIINTEDKKKLDKLKIHPRETYSEVFKRIIKLTEDKK